MNYSYNIKVVTPLTIGNGNYLLPLEYTVFPKEGIFCRVNIEKLINRSDFDANKFLNRAFYLGDKFSNLVKLYASYSLQMNSLEANALHRQSMSGNVRVQEAIKEGGHPYVPGSSIKGALRTVILKSFLSNERNRLAYEESLKREVEKANRERKKIKKEYFSNTAEKNLVGNTRDSLFRVLKISDSKVLPRQTLSVELVKILNQSRQGFCWKVTGRESRDINDPERATSIFTEAIKPGTITEGTMILDEYLLNKEIASAAGIKNINFFDNFIEKSKQVAENALNEEIGFFSQANQNKIVKLLHNLKERQKKISNGFLLQMSWGAGYNSKTTGKQIDQKLFQEIRRFWSIGRTDFLFPKTRKVVFKEGEPVSVMGWVEIVLRK